MSSTGRPARERGTALAIVLWALVALAALSTAAVVTSITDLALARAHRDHAAALGLAEAGLAEALAVLAADPLAAGRSDSLSGALSSGSYQTSWAPVGGRARIVSTGESRGLRRQVEAWVVTGERVRVVAWREAWR
ncbi:MAG: hypothetical protein ACREMD_09310 [Gemmatimonadota bacterium]